jgi:serine/threonine-protein kinase RsbW
MDPETPVLPHEIELLIDSQLLNLDLVGGAIGGIAATLGLDETERYHLELCAVEAVSNSIRHAYRGAAGKPVRVRITAEDSRIEMRIADQGTPVPMERRVPPPSFNTAPDPPDASEASDATELLEEGGRGLFLMFTLMDEVVFGCEEGWNFVALTKRRPVS